MPTPGLVVLVATTEWTMPVTTLAHHRHDCNRVASPREPAAAEYHARHERAVRAAQAAAARRMSGGMLS